MDAEPFPTLGPLVAQFIRERAVFGPGSLQGQPATLHADLLGVLYRMYEVWPAGHPREGQRRFNRGVVEWKKGLAKTEAAAWISYAELHPEGPVRFAGWGGVA